MSLKIGQRVWFFHYGQIKQGYIARFSQGSGSIVYLTDGRWLHRASVNPVD